MAAFGPPSIAQGALPLPVMAYMEQTGAGRGKKKGRKKTYWCHWKLRAGSHVTAEERISRLSSQRGNKLLASPLM